MTFTNEHPRAFHIRSCISASMKDMGKVMGILKPKVQGRTDMGALSARIKSALGA